jgi:Flp pilus assembly protein TadD
VRAAFAFAVLLSLGACASTAAPEVTEAPIEKLGPEAVVLAERAIAAGRFEDAREILDRVLLGDPENVNAKLALAELALARGATGAAQQAFAPLTSTPGVEARALQGEGISLLLMGEEVAGSNRLQRAVDADPTLWRAWNGLGSYHDGRGEWTAAIESYEKALAIQPKSLMVQNNLGYSYFMQGRLDDAIAILTRVLEREPGFELARANLRLAYARKGQYVHALSGSGDRELGRNLNNVGYIALLRGDYENAESYLLRAMEEEASFNRVAWRNLGYLKNLREIEAAEASATFE